MSDPEDEVFSKYPAWTWDFDGRVLVLPVQRWSRGRGAGLVAHQRVNRNGARHDMTGSEAGTWDCTLFAQRDSEEQGVAADFFPSGVALLDAQVDVDAVGTLMTPLGPRRCRIDNVSWVIERPSGVDASVMQVKFVEDNEDDATVAAFEAPNVRSAADDMLLAVEGLSNRVGAGGGDMFDSIKEATATLVGLANFPGDSLAQVITQIAIIDSSILAVGEAYYSAPADVADTMSALLNDPLAGPAVRALEQLLDAASRAAADQQQRGRGRVIKTYDRVVSIFDVSFDVEQDASELIDMNASIPDLTEIAPRTPITVFA